jgi:hypothetical protein
MSSNFGTAALIVFSLIELMISETVTFFSDLLAEIHFTKVVGVHVCGNHASSTSLCCLFKPTDFSLIIKPA